MFERPYDAFFAEVRVQVARIYGIPLPAHLGTVADQALLRGVSAEQCARELGRRFHLAELAATPQTFLVGCSKTKGPRRVRAEDLYTGTLFRRARAYVEARGGQWFILSAKHGLVAPTTALDPYDVRLRDLSEPGLRRWGARVREQLAWGGVKQRPLVALAGRVYREAMDLPADDLIAPLEGLGFGEQMAWLAAHTVSADDRAEAA